MAAPGLKKLSHRHTLIVQFAAMGLRAKEIGAKLGMTQSRLSLVINDPRVQAEIREVRRKMFEEVQAELVETNPDKALQEMLPDGLKAIKNVLNPLSGSTDKVRLDAAFRLLERTHGRAVQKTEITGSVDLRALFSALEQQAYRSGTKTVTIEVEDPDDTKSKTVEQTDRSSDTENSVGEIEFVEPEPEVETVDPDAFLDVLGSPTSFQVGKEPETES